MELHPDINNLNFMKAFTKFIRQSITKLNTDMYDSESIHVGCHLYPIYYYSIYAGQSDRVLSAPVTDSINSKLMDSEIECYLHLDRTHLSHLSPTAPCTLHRQAPDS